ncbi:cytochrome P450 [Lentzea tibetensis]|uniref:Cytochrome P450 n=1 Tax=Lentzea tibetensis TaxID=2591470 RepID=A0A563EU19_9PSEU|nr:cytochrome P450 [Lentzea tibetensis]TWP50624.1 cytochrome P450 [Lentzea tibetensis]
MRFATGPDDPRLDEVDPSFQSVIEALGPLVAASKMTRRRVFHRNATGARGVLRVVDAPDLPPHSFFRPGRRFDVTARYSNSIENDDIAPAIRGVTLRLDGGELDLSLNTGDRFFARSAEVFLRYFRGEGAALVEEIPGFRETAWNLYRHATSYASYHYYSQVPSGFVSLDGSRWLIRYRLVPVGVPDAGFVDPGDRFLPPEPPGELTRFDADDPRPRTFLHEELRERLSAGAVSAVLQVQLHPVSSSDDENEAPLDCTRAWNLPWRDLATLELDSMLDNDAIEGLRFNHANTPADLGVVLATSPSEPASLNHLRALVYRLTAAARIGDTSVPECRSVVVIGAGPAGLSFARELERAGHRAIVLEKLPEVGGKCESIDIDDRAYDLGGHVCTTQYENVARLAVELGVPTEDTTPHRVHDIESGSSVPQSTEFFQRATFSRYQELRDAEFPLIASAGLAHSARALAEPVTSWLSSHGLTSMAASLGTGYTAAGYGYLAGDLPALYFVKYAEMTGLLSARPELLGHPGSFTIVGGFKGLWEKVAASLSDVRCGVNITCIARDPDRPRNGVLVRTEQGDVVADDLVLTVPISELVDVLDATPDELDVAGRVRSMDYYTTVVSASGLPSSAFFLVDNVPGHAVSFHHRYPESDVYAVYSYGSPELDGDDIIAGFRADVERMGGTMGEVHTQRRWKFLPYFGSADIRDGVYDRIEHLQGRNHTFHAGSLPAYELVECNVAYSRQLVRQHFGGADEDDVFGHAAVITTEERPEPTVDALRTWLVSHIADELRLPATSVSASSRLDSFALESMSVAALQSGLSDWLGYRIPHTLFLEQPTIDAVARHLAVEEDAPPVAPTRSLLLGLTSARPFFCVGGALGAAYYLLKLARDVGSSRPFYGLRAPGYDGLEEPLDTVEELAARYVEEIRLVQPYGPYLLGGHSFGGVVAYEMGRQLRAAGEEVTRVVLLDAYVPVAGQDLPPVDDAAAIEELLTMNRLAFSSGGPAGVEIDPSLAISEQKERLGRFLGANGSLPVDDHISNMLRVYQANLEANVKYQPLPSDLNVTLMKATDGFPPVMKPHRNTALALDDPANGWEHVSLGTLSVVDIPGDHFTMFVEPHDEIIAGAVHTCLAEEERRSANTVGAKAIAFNPDDPAFLNDPYPFYRALRDSDPIHYEDTLGGWMLTRYEDVSQLLRDPRVIRPPVTDYLFASVPQSQRDEMAAFERQLAGSLPFTNAPYHTRLRSLLGKAFTPRRVRAMRARIAEITDSLLDVLDVCDGGDLMKLVAYPLPSTVIMEFIGVPEEDHARMTYLATEMMALLGAQYSKDAPLIARKAHAAMNEFVSYMTSLISLRRSSPREDLLSTLIGGELTEEELILNCMALLNAGLETTANLLGNGTLALLRNPAQYSLLRNDPQLAESAAEELLRYDGPTPILTPQLADADISIGGQLIKKGQLIYPMVGAANRDPVRFPEPDQLDVTRPPNGQLSFGVGIHFCVGAALARMEAQEYFTRLTARFPHLRLDPSMPAPVFRDDPLLRGLAHLHVRTSVCPKDN